MTSPFFSIVIPTYNRAAFLPKAINSVLSQTFANWELIIVDDGSTDNTRDVVGVYKDDRIKYIYQKNEERCVARNNGVNISSGEYVCFLDSDDYYLNIHLETLFVNITNNQNPVAMFATAGFFLNSENKLVKRAFYVPDGRHPIYYLINNSIFPNNVCIHKKIFERFNFVNIIPWEDTHLWVRIASVYPFFQIPLYTAVLVDHLHRSVNFFLKNNQSFEEIDKSILGVKDLFENRFETLWKFFSKSDKEQYIIKIYQMIVYEARVQGQFKIAFHFAFKSLMLKFNSNNLIILFKLVIHNVIFLFKK